MDAVLLQFAEQVGIGLFKDFILSENCFLDSLERRFRAVAQDVPGLIAEKCQASESCHPDPEILIEVIGIDPEEIESLQERHIAVGGFLQYPGVEREPAYLLGNVRFAHDRSAGVR